MQYAGMQTVVTDAVELSPKLCYTMTYAHDYPEGIHSREACDNIVAYPAWKLEA